MQCPLTGPREICWIIPRTYIRLYIRSWLYTPKAINMHSNTFKIYFKLIYILYLNVDIWCCALDIICQQSSSDRLIVKRLESKLKVCEHELRIWRSQMQSYWRREAEPLKRIFATVKSTIDTDNSSNTVLLFLFLWNSPNVYTLVWKHTNKRRIICTFQM
jgi:hypothetical protein